MTATPGTSMCRGTHLRACLVSLLEREAIRCRRQHLVGRFVCLRFGGSFVVMRLV